MNAAIGTALTRAPRALSWRARGLLVAGFTALSSLFALLHYTPLQFVSVNLVQGILLVGLAALAAVGCALRVPVLLLASGTILIVAGLVRLVTYGQTIGIISGSVNAAALMVGLGTAFVAIWSTSRPMPATQ
ncbi:Rv1678 family membrane protein [Cryobacterium psychrophilum]|uniref:Uncharacterized protein n=1 Tax=Cryobacterium psychrophilum TaxID=41988 RepID=A0A4Y8KLC6_9MICO|nr:hypothetical protein [Cryobacterium psychrophilum]TDW30854.1 hypothetical protein EDD25_2632 [Cryobacterium psychrophilum]TFD75756.1 hypothetical protein E3T53_14850 [Cryobacterium psychrophilum]